MTLVKTSQGGFNLESVTRWYTEHSGDLKILLLATESESWSNVILSGDEAECARAILEGVCIFDTTKGQS